MNEHVNEAEPSHDSLKPFEFAQTVVVQLLTLATAITTVTLTFFNDFESHPTTVAKSLAIASWAAFLLSIAFGILTLGAMTGVIGTKSANMTIYAENITRLGAAQMLTFFVALVLVVTSGAVAIA